MILRIILLILVVVYSLSNLIRGYILKYIAIKDMDNKWGHKTKTSKENINNWQYANYLSGTLHIVFGNILLFINVMVYYIFAIQLKANFYALLATLILLINAVIMLLIHYITEVFLKKHLKKVKNNEEE